MLSSLSKGLKEETFCSALLFAYDVLEEVLFFCEKNTLPRIKFDRLNKGRKGNLVKKSVVGYGV